MGALFSSIFLSFQVKVPFTRRIITPSNYKSFFAHFDRGGSRKNGLYCSVLGDAERITLYAFPTKVNQLFSSENN